MRPLFCCCCKDAENVYNKMIRKFNKTPDAWIKYAIFEYKNGNCEVARKLLLKCLNSLEKRDRELFFLSDLTNEVGFECFYAQIFLIV